MSGFDCQFTEDPPKVLQCYCPICLLILHEPYQVTCCGKSYCKLCIELIQAKGQPCPTCKQEFTSFLNLGLQQPLYGLSVFCSNKEGGCGWQGELGQLDQHLNVNPIKEKQLVGCGFTRVKCSFCSKLYERRKLKYHQDSKCSKRSFICKMCNNYTSTYDDVTTNHAPECKCRPVECPNSCGASNLQHQHLEQHVSNQCPLTLVECEFSDAGCDAKMYRRDLPSHLSTNMVTHMSLLARENRKLKQELKDVTEETVYLKMQLKTVYEDFENHMETMNRREQDNSLFKTFVKSFPLDLLEREMSFELLEDTVNSIHGFYSTPFYTNHGCYKICVCIRSSSQSTHIAFVFLDSEFPVLERSRVHISSVILDQLMNKDHINLEHKLVYDQQCSHKNIKVFPLLAFDKTKHMKNGRILFKIKQVRVF